MKGKKIVSTRLYKLLIIMFDLLITGITLYSTIVINNILFTEKIDLMDYNSNLMFVFCTYLIFMYIYDLNNLMDQNVFDIIISLFLVVALSTIVMILLNFLFKELLFSNKFLILYASSQFIMLSIWRILILRVFNGFFVRKDAIVIEGSNCCEVSKKIKSKGKNFFKIKYICNDKSNELIKNIKECEVVFVCSDVSKWVKDKIIDECVSSNKEIYIIPDLYEMMILNSRLFKIDDLPFLKINDLQLTKVQSCFKRVMDILLATFALILASPLFLLISIFIKLEDGGKIFYIQERLSLNDKRFKLIKFRTMVMDAEKYTGPTLASEQDDRITKIGKILRSMRLDELPQLLNILSGDMSIVGPRPERPIFAEKYNQEVNSYRYRTKVKSGLTGLAQIMGKYSTLPEDKSKYDLIYIKNYNILLDIKIIFQTIRVLFIKESSKGIEEQGEVIDIVKKIN